MRVTGSLVVHLIWILIQLLRPGGTRAVIAESLLIKHPLLIINRSKRRAEGRRNVVLFRVELDRVEQP